MSISEEKNGLLARIRASVESLLPINQHNKRCDTFNMTDDIRQKVLQVLVTFLMKFLILLKSVLMLAI